MIVSRRSNAAKMARRCESESRGAVTTSSCSLASTSRSNPSRSGSMASCCTSGGGSDGEVGIANGGARSDGSVAMGTSSEAADTSSFAAPDASDASPDASPAAMAWIAAPRLSVVGAMPAALVPACTCAPCTCAHAARASLFAGASSCPCRSSPSRSRWAHSAAFDMSPASSSACNGRSERVVHKPTSAAS